MSTSFILGRPPDGVWSRMLEFVDNPSRNIGTVNIEHKIFCFLEGWVPSNSKPSKIHSFNKSRRAKSPQLIMESYWNI